MVATPVAQWLGASNSCINPVLYCFFNDKYRRGFAAIIRSRSCCGTAAGNRNEDGNSYRTTTQRSNTRMTSLLGEANKF